MPGAFNPEKPGNCTGKREVWRRCDTQREHRWLWSDPNPNQSQTLCPAWIYQHCLGRDLKEIRAGNTLSTERKNQGVAEKRWEMQTPENVLAPASVGGSVAEQRLKAELQEAFLGKGNPILSQL